MSVERGKLDLRLRTVGRWSWIAGAAGLTASLAGAWTRPSSFFPGYLFAYVFWVGLSLGALAVLMIHYQVGGSWGFMTRRILEAATRVLPVLAVLFVPLLFGVRVLYPWARSETVREDPHLLHQSSYLNLGFFIGRAVFYFACWITCAGFLNHWSTLGDRAADPALWTRRRRLSGGGLALYALTTYFASVDWVLSTEPRWSSTIYGMLFMAGQGLAAFALITSVVVLLSRESPLREIVTSARLNDLGNLLLTSVMLWAYLSFSQYLFIWSENLPREVTWVANRTSAGWRTVAVALIILHFAVPFFLLLFRGVKTRGSWIAAVAFGLLVLRLLDDFWLVIPAFEPRGLAIHWTFLAAPVGIGGVWVGVFVGALRRRPLVPLSDSLFEPVVAEARIHG
jgi:hypothetical protein